MSWKKVLIPASAIPIVALLAYGLTRDPNIVESPLPGHAAFEFTSPTLDGDTLSLGDLEGKVVVLNFWASWCIACIDEHRVFVEAERYYAGQDFQMLGVVYQDSPENARRWMARMGGSWPSVSDPNSRIAIDYGVYGVPETYFIARDGRIAYKQIGPVNAPLMVHWVDRLLAESSDAAATAAETLEGEVPTGRSEGHTGDPSGAAADRQTQGGQ
ncbi:MAG: redoxin domain-containing protein [Gemmatimonadetes bacterium]|nr:redoxin domain-containing protein [Gemmatimonadota bacterium]NIO33022.1 redoxin domain-containing protein [Gemmatimonadota bacterium]